MHGRDENAYKIVVKKSRGKRPFGGTWILVGGPQRNRL
jgi:hypothetical protein